MGSPKTIKNPEPLEAARCKHVVTHVVSPFCLLFFLLATVAPSTQKIYNADCGGSPDQALPPRQHIWQMFFAEKKMSSSDIFISLFHDLLGIPTYKRLQDFFHNPES